MSMSWFRLVCLVAAAMSAAEADAAVVSANYLGHAKYNGHAISASGATGHVGTTDISTGSGGAFSWDLLTNTSGVPLATYPTGANAFQPTGGSSPNLITYCLEVNSLIASNPVTFEAVVDIGTYLGSAAAGNAMELLWQSYFSAVLSGGATEAAAFQLAVWELKYDGAADVLLSNTKTDYLTATHGSASAMGNFSATPTNSAIVALANSWLHSIFTSGQTATTVLVALVDNSGQDQLAVRDPSSIPNVGAVPEPASLAVWSVLGLFGIAAGRWKKQD